MLQTMLYRARIPGYRGARPASWAAGVLVFFLLVPPGCGLNRSGPEEDVPRPDIVEVQERHTPEWMKLPRVIGTGIGLCDEEPCIRVFLSAASPEAEKAIPEKVEGYRVEVVVTGVFRPRGPGG
jgi:hypothetical protein